HLFGRYRRRSSWLGCVFSLLSGRFSLQPFRFLLCELDDRRALFDAEARKLCKLIRLDHRQVIETEEALLDEVFGQLIRRAWDMAESLDRLVELLVELFTGHDLDVPADELRGQPYVLSSLPDRQ